tara:strand:- start:24 stop:176 length:153 start_codon:yes stop_codon:yes gene_type:complete
MRLIKSKKEFFMKFLISKLLKKSRKIGRYIIAAGGFNNGAIARDMNIEIL